MNENDDIDVWELIAPRMISSTTPLGNEMSYQWTHDGSYVCEKHR